MQRVSTYDQLGLPEPLAIAFTLASLALVLTPYLPGADFGLFRVPRLEHSVARRLKILGPVLLGLCVVGFVPMWSGDAPREPRYSIEFENVSLAAAVLDLDRRATEVEIALSPELASGKIATKPFSISLEGATLSEVLDAFSNKAAGAVPLAWRLSGRTVIIEAQTPSQLPSGPPNGALQRPSATK